MIFGRKYYDKNDWFRVDSYDEQKGLFNVTQELKGLRESFTVTKDNLDDFFEEYHVEISNSRKVFSGIFGAEHYSLTELASYFAAFFFDMRNLHLNTTGDSFYTYHELCQDLYEHAEEFYDSLVETATNLGEVVPMMNENLPSDWNSFNAVDVSVAGTKSAIASELQIILDKIKSVKEGCDSFVYSKLDSMSEYFDTELYKIKQALKSSRNIFSRFLLLSTKDRFINMLPVDDSVKTEFINFFKTHANLENKISWNDVSKNPDDVVNQIKDLIQTTDETKQRKKKGDSFNLSDCLAHDCKYMGESEHFWFVSPLSYEGAKYCDSNATGGPAKWCIGYENSDEYWNKYIYDNKSSFVMAVNKDATDKMIDHKVMIEITARSYKVWSQDDKKVCINGSIRTNNKNLKTMLLNLIPEFEPIKQEGVNLFDDIRKKFNNEKMKKFSNYFEEVDGYQVIKSVEALKHIKEFKMFLVNVKFNPDVDWSVVTDASGMFSYCESLKSIDCSGFTNVTNAKSMFSGCTSLKSIDCSGFANVTNAHYMFYYCESLKSIDCSGFTNVTNAQSMFFYCKSLKSIDCSGFTNVTDAKSMFYGCKSLESIDCKPFINVSNAAGMFEGCTSLKSIDCSGFTNVTNAWGMFSYCKSLESIDCSAFTNVVHADYMFDRCSDNLVIKNGEHLKKMFN